MFIEEPQQLADEAVVGGNCAIAYAGERFLAVLLAKRCQDVRVIGMDSPREPRNTPNHLPVRLSSPDGRGNRGLTSGDGVLGVTAARGVPETGASTPSSPGRRSAR